MSESTDELLHATPANRKRVGSVLKKSPVKKKRTGENLLTCMFIVII